MKRPANLLTLSLIISSTALLLVLEAVWLGSSYQDEKELLRREANFLFRSTVFDLQDSLIQKSIQPLKKDSAVMQFYGTRRPRADSLQFINHVIAHDRRILRRTPATSENIQIYISSPKGADSLKSIYRPLISRIRTDSGHRTFSINIETDTLSITDIDRKFRQVLATSSIDLPFTINRLNPDEELPSQPLTVTTELVPTFSSNRYAASFENASWWVLKKITPQILFSAFLSSLTMVSFVFLYRSIRNQQRLVSIKNDFISNVTHELKTPIATVSVALEALKNFKGIDNPQLTNEYLDIARFELERLTLLTDKVLTTSLFDEQGVKLDLEPVDLEKTVAGILRSLKLAFEKRNAVVKLETDGTSFTVQGSAIHLTNVVYNLVDNAMKYSHGQPDITLRIRDKGDQVELSVSDKGAGIPIEYQSKVFDKFFRIPTGDVHTVKGHGLGLNYVRTVAEAHHGSIRLESKAGEGSTFILTFPKNPQARNG